MVMVSLFLCSLWTVEIFLTTAFSFILLKKKNSLRIRDTVSMSIIVMIMCFRPVCRHEAATGGREGSV